MTGSKVTYNHSLMYHGDYADTLKVIHEQVGSKEFMYRDVKHICSWQVFMKMIPSRLLVKIRKSTEKYWVYTINKQIVERFYGN